MSRPYAKVLKRFEDDRTSAPTDPSGSTFGREFDDEPRTVPAAPGSPRRRRKRRKKRAYSGFSPSKTPATAGTPQAPLDRPPLKETGAPSLLVPRGPNQAQLTRSGLLDVLRTVAPKHSCPCVVIVGVSGVESLSNLMLGLARQAGANGLGFMHVQATSGPQGRSLNILENTSDSDDDRYAIGTLEHWNQTISGGATRGCELDQWLEEASLHHDLILVEGPSLDQSLEAAFLGSQCDGVLLAAEVDRTHRAALSLAAERAAASGCRVLGVVLTETKRWLPRWLDRLLDEMMP